ncbi:MAG: hypothetical protein RID91_09510 [Azospirillaceae bacterium]
MMTRIRTVLILALGDRLIGAMLAAIAAVALLAGFLGDRSVAEQGATGLAFAGFGLRLTVIAGLVLHVVFQIRREIDSRELLLALSRPVSRAGLVVAWWAGFAVIGAGLATAAGLAVAATGPADPAGLALWTGSLALEAALMAAFALFFALGLNGTVAAAIGCLGFYVLGRMVGVIEAIRRSPLRAPDTELDRGLDRGFDLLGLLVPRLDLFGQGAWLVHGPPEPGLVALIATQGAVFTALLVVAAVIDFRGKAL